MNENEIAQQIVDAALRVHMALGPGLLESVYQTTLEYELKKRRLRVLRIPAKEISIPI
jgi:GxxExxY protein